MGNLNVAVAKNEKKKVTYTLDSDILSQFNQIAKTKKYNKSQTINNLIKLFINTEDQK